MRRPVFSCLASGSGERVTDLEGDHAVLDTGGVILDVVEIGQTLKDGAIILGIEINNAALGAGVTLDVGDADDPNRYIDGYDANGNTKTNTLLIGGLFYKIGTNDDDNVIQVLIQDAAATGELNVTVYYTED